MAAEHINAALMPSIKGIIMLSLLCLLSLNFQFLKREESSIECLCVDEGCNGKAFTGRIHGKCPEYVWVGLPLEVFGRTPDDDYYIVKINQLNYFVKKACVFTDEESPLMSIRTILYDVLPLEHFLESTSRIINDTKTILTDSDHKSDVDNKEKLFENIQTPSSTVSRESEGYFSDSEYDKEFDSIDNEPVDPLADSNQTRPDIKDGESDYWIWITVMLSQLTTTFSNAMENALPGLYMNFMNHFLALQDLPSVRFYQVLCLCLFLLLFFQFLRKFRSSHYQIAIKSLSKLYTERLALLEESELNLRAKLEISQRQILHENENESLNAELMTLRNELKQETVANSNFISQIQNLEAQLNSLKNVSNNNCRSDSEQRKNLEEIQAELVCSNEKINQLIAEKHLSSSYAEAQQYVDSFIQLFLSELVHIGPSLHSAINDLQCLNNKQISDGLFKISKKLSDYDVIEKKATEVSVFVEEAQTLKIEKQKLVQEFEGLKEKLRLKEQEAQEMLIEKNVIKRHFKETQTSMLEDINTHRQRVVELQHQLCTIPDDRSFIPDLKKNIQELKVEVETLEAEKRKLKEEYSIDLNSLYVNTKKLERNFEKERQEKENYRLKLLKVLDNNQRLENEKNTGNDEVLVSKHYSTPPSRRSESPVRGGFYAESGAGSAFFPPPPPPPFPHFGMPFPFFPHNSSSPNSVFIGPRFPHSTVMGNIQGPRPDFPFTSTLPEKEQNNNIV